MRDALIFFLFLFFIFVAFGGKAKASTDVQNISEIIWGLCKDSDSEDKTLDCFDFYNNCIINQGLPYKEEYTLNCIKEKAKSDK